MSRQINYITSAFFFIILFTGIIQFIIKLPATKGSEIPETGCGTENPVSNAVLSATAQKGKMLFNSKCASCHILNKESTGPALAGFEERGPWANRKKVYEWIKNPAAFMMSDDYTKKLKERYGSVMSSFTDISREEIDAICDYINEAGRNSTMPIASN